VSAGIPSDAKERERALDPRRSFIVQAPAGSGKTELLVRRYLNLLSVVQKPEEILAITFTKKAAAEMRKRVLERLPGAAEIAHRLRIQTIDALCASLTRQMPVLARFGAQPEIVEDAAELYREAALRVLNDLNGSSEKLLRHLDNNVAAVAGLLARLLARRDQWLRKAGAAPTRAELEGALLLERERLLKKARSLFPGASEELARRYLTTAGEWTKRPPTPPELQQVAGLREALCALYSMPPAKYEDRQWEALEAILALLFPAVSHLKIIFGETGKADFTEFAHGALRALGSVDDPSDLLLSLDQRISHILVDEFQDTSFSQFELIAKLTSGWTGSGEAGGDGRTLFLVGDPMQSIYRFREAEVALFIQAKNSGLGPLRLEPLTLTTNFRSQRGIVDWVNASFSRILPSAEDETSGAVVYSPSSAHDPALPGPAVSWHGFYDRGAEASQVVKILKQAAGKSAILVRNRSHLDAIVPALKDARIPFRAVDIEQLGEKQVVQDLYALTRALSHPGDRIAALAVLRAPWCGLSLADFCLLAENREEALVSDLLLDVSQLSPDGQARVARVRAVLGPAMAERLRGTLRDRVEGAWLALGGPACLGGQDDDATALEDAEIFLDELERLEEAGEVDLQALEESLGRLYALPDVNAGPGAVEIMTVHKAKGLEFDTVILPGLDRSPRSGAKPLFAWKSLPGARLLLAPIDETGAADDPIYAYVRSLEKEAEDIEAGRLFYVAATRAKQRLHLLACASCDKEPGELKSPGKRSLLGRIWWQAQEHFGPAPADAGKDSPPAQLPDLLRRFPADFALPALSDSTLWKSAEAGREEMQIEFSWAGETARHVGTVVHRWLQRIAEDELRGWDASRIDSLRENFSRELARRGVRAADSKSAADLVCAALKSTLADERGRWILGPHPEARTEYRMRVRSPDGARSYAMDRVFRDRGELWIVDYKTSRHEGAGLDAFLDRELERYAPQLASYGAALPGSRQGLYFALLRGWREPSPDGLLV
jgi:ATP-dependent helicase/nuclease subunit A